VISQSFGPGRPKNRGSSAHARPRNAPCPSLFDGDHTDRRRQLVDSATASLGVVPVTRPHGGWIPSAPVIPGLGFPLGTWAQMFALDPEHSNVPGPGKRPRTTLTPSLVTKDGKPLMVFGTPGGDQQDQWTLQFSLNLAHFGMDIQQALAAPTFHRRTDVRWRLPSTGDGECDRLAESR